MNKIQNPKKKMGKSTLLLSLLAVCSLGLAVFASVGAFALTNQKDVDSSGFVEYDGSVALSFENGGGTMYNADGTTFTERRILPGEPVGELPYVAGVTDKVFAGWKLSNGNRIMSESIIYSVAPVTVYAIMVDSSSSNPSGCEGSGTETDPYQIYTLQQLQNIATKVNAGTTFSGEYFTLMNDIDMGKYYNATTARSWTRIGYSSTYSFVGILDGKSNTIKNLYMKNSTTTYQGLFGYLKNATVKNLKLTGEVWGGSYTGGLAGYASGSSIINCTTEISVTGSANYFGGLLGYATGGCRITSCANLGALVSYNSSGTAQNYVGGISGYDSGGTYTNCTNSAPVNNPQLIKSSYTGGIIGQALNSNIDSCKNFGSVTGSDYSGGVIGSTQSGNVSNSSNSGTVTCSGQNIAGIVGGNGAQSGSIVGATISGCVNKGNITGNTERVGGIAGINYGAIITLCKNTAQIIGNSSNTTSGYTGGVVGINHGNATVDKSLNTGVVLANGVAVGGVVGINLTSTVINCGNTGNVCYSSSYTNSQVGGIVGACEATGINSGQTASTVSSYNRATYIGYTGRSTRVGGLAGVLTRYGNLYNCYSNTSNVLGTYAGRMVGDRNGTTYSPVTYCYAYGTSSTTFISVNGGTAASGASTSTSPLSYTGTGINNSGYYTSTSHMTSSGFATTLNTLLTSDSSSWVYNSSKNGGYPYPSAIEGLL